MNDKALLPQKPLVDRYLARGPRPISAFSFVSIFAWCDFFDFEIKTIDEALCIFARQGAASFLYLPPLGPFDAATLKAAFAHMSASGVPHPANRIENIPENLLSAFGEDEYNHFTKQAEYVYRKENLVALKGCAYKSQRHDYNCFKARHPKFRFEPYTESDLEGCLMLYDSWAEGRRKIYSNEIYRCLLEENRRVHHRLLVFCQSLGLTARVLKDGDRLVGYTFGFRLDENSFCVYAEISDLNVAGAAAFMFRSLCADSALKSFSLINTMDDFALPNVAVAKKAYHPSGLIPSYSASLKNR